MSFVEQPATATFETEYSAALDEAERHDGPVSLQDMRRALRQCLGEGDDTAGEKELRAFADFDGFYDWLDTLTAYDQLDNDQSLYQDKPCLEIAYRSLLAGYQD